LSNIDLPLEGFKSKGVMVEVKDLVKVYKMSRGIEVQALRGLNMVVKPSEAVTIMGPSGSGKTTLLNLIGGIDRPTAGSVVVDNVKVHELNESKLEEYRLKMVGYIFQAFNLIPVLTSLENVELPMIALGIPKSKRIKRAKWLLELVGLGHRLHHRPTELSGGEQQRVAIAVALANDPPLILADEPTAELDTENAMRIIDLLTKLSREYGKTVIVSTHDPRIAIRTNRILKIEDGVIMGEYSPIELEEKPELTRLTDLADTIKTRIASIEKQMQKLAEKLGKGEITYEEFDREYNRLKILLAGYKELLSSLGH